MSFHLYIIQSEISRRYYVGQTQNLQARLAQHNSDRSKSSKHRGPWTLVYSEAYSTRAEAMKRERQIKSWKDTAMIERLIGTQQNGASR
jgi:putative endonuclease